MTSYKGLLNKIEAFCSAHFQIEKYAGEFKEQMPNFATKDEKYPIVYVVPQSDTSDLNTNQFTLDVYCVDITQKDRANINTIVSDCNLIVNDLYLYFLDGNDLSIDVVGSSSGNPVNNFDLDYTAGWVKTITFEVNQYNVCAIPMNPINPNPPIVCDPAIYNLIDTLDNILASGSINSGATENIIVQDSIIKNSDESYVVSLTAQSVLDLPNIKVTDSDGSTYEQPSVIDVVCTYVPPCEDASYNLKNTNGQQLSSGTIPSGGTSNITAPDSLYSVNNTLNTTLYSGNIPSGTSDIIVIHDATVENSDASYSASVLAEGSLVLPDITVDVTNSALTVVNTTTVASVQDVTISAPDGTINIKKTGDGTISSQSVPSGATIDYSVADNAITVNSGNGFSIDATDPLDIVLTDGTSSVTPTSVTYSQGQHKVDIVLPTSGTPIDSDAQRFIDATAITDTTIQNALDVAVVALKDNGLWSRIYAWYPFVGGSATTHKFNIKDPRNTDDALRLTFFGGITHNANGITGNGSTGYADTHFNMLSGGIYRESFGMSQYIRNAGWSGYAHGITDGGSSFSGMFRTGTDLYYFVYGDTSVIGTVATATKLLTQQRSASNLTTLYRSGSSVLTNTATTQAFINQTMYLLARNSGGSAVGLSTANLASTLIHKAFSGAEVATLNTIIETFETSLSRNV